MNESKKPHDYPPNSMAAEVAELADRLADVRHALRVELDTARPRWLARIVTRFMDRKEPA